MSIARINLQDVNGEMIYKGDKLESLTTESLKKEFVEKHNIKSIIFKVKDDFDILGITVERSFKKENNEMLMWDEIDQNTEKKEGIFTTEICSNVSELSYLNNFEKIEKKLINKSDLARDYLDTEEYFILFNKKYQLGTKILLKLNKEYKNKIVESYAFLYGDEITDEKGDEKYTIENNHIGDFNHFLIEPKEENRKLKLEFNPVNENGVISLHKKEIDSNELNACYKRIHQDLDKKYFASQKEKKEEFKRLVAIEKERLSYVEPVKDMFIGLYSSLKTIENMVEKGCFIDKVITK